MSSIDFFVPVVYNNQIKTIPQQVLETIDEYFYLGGKFRVSIFANDTNNLPCAGHNLQDRHRSWTNIAIKVASYCSIILPLVALLIKAALRCYLQISSLRVYTHRDPQIENFAKLSATGFEPPKQAPKSLQGAGDMAIAEGRKDGDAEAGKNPILEFKKLPKAILAHIGSFVSYQDRARMSTAMNKEIFNYKKLIEPLQKKIDALCVAFPADRNSQLSLPDNDLQQLLVELIISPILGHPHYWVPLMDSLIQYLGPVNTADAIIQQHARIAKLLASSEKPISSDQIYQFCRYIGETQLSPIKPWIGYRALEQYSLNQKLHPTSVNQALEEYLTQRANILIKVKKTGYCLPPNRILSYQMIDIDPRRWFGSTNTQSSLWMPQDGDAQNDATAPMPELLLNVLWRHIQSLRGTSPANKPFMVVMTGRSEAELPINFTLPLAKHITNADIFLNHDNTINTDEIENEKRFYAQSFSSLSKEYVSQHYRDAITIDLSSQQWITI